MSALAWVGTSDGRGAFVEPPLVDAGGPGVQRGLGLFETLRCHAGRLPLWARHLARLRASAAAVGLPAPDDAIVAPGLELLHRAGLGDDGVLRVTLLAAADGARVVLTCRPRRGAPVVRLARVATRRDAADPTARHKTTARLFWELAQRQAEQLGADEALCCGAGGQVLEATNHNLFAELGGRWVTPPADGAILPGVARGLLLEAGVAVEAPIGFDRLAAASRIAVTNAVHGPRPAVVGVAGGAPVADLAAVWQGALGG